MEVKMKAMNQVLDGIKVLKLYEWEASFKARPKIFEKWK